MKKFIAILCVLVLALAMTSTAFAASTCPKCSQKKAEKSCNSSLGRSDNPNWQSCPITATCLYDYVSYWTAIECSGCHHSDNAYQTHIHKLEHKKCSTSQYKANQCPY